MQTPDPVAEGRAYREMLLALVGDDDPEVIASETPERLRSLVKDAGDLLRTRPEPMEWSALELVAHITDAELVCAARYRWTIAHDAPELMGYDQDLWVDRLHANDQDPEDILELFETLRRANVALWRRSSAEQRARVSLHAERGPETYAQLFTMMAGHDRFHVDQLTRTIRYLRNA